MRWMKLDQVVCISQAQPDERPLKFRRGADWLPVENVLETWLEGSAWSGEPVFRVFRINCSLGRCRLRVALDGWCWELAVES